MPENAWKGLPAGVHTDAARGASRFAMSATRQLVSADVATDALVNRVYLALLERPCQTHLGETVGEGPLTRGCR